MTVPQILWHNFQQALIAFDCLCNVIVCTLGLQEAGASETLSAHAWRARDKAWGKFFKVVIDVMFSWQAVDPAFTDANGVPIRSHCERAFAKERAKFYLPTEYKEVP